MMSSDQPQGVWRKRLEFSERRRLKLTRSLARHSFDEDGLLWSIADLMTLLLIFFVVFHGAEIGSPAGEPPARPESARAIAPMAQQPPAHPPESRERLLPPAPVVETTTRDEELPGTAFPEWVGQLEADVHQLLEGQGNQAFAVRWDARRLVIVLGEQITFNEGTAELLTAFLPVLHTIAQRLKELPAYGIQVAGHTDNTPIHNDQYPSNWELSAGRAVNVARFLIHRGVAPERVSIEGFAEFQPLAPNTTDAKRQLNRRVEITLLGPEA